jgi:hypothetical protein
MSAPSLPQQLLRDLRRNPKKAGLLAILAGVALWFWAPLVAGWFKASDPGSTNVEQPTTAPLIPVAAMPNEAHAPVKAAETASQAWQQQVQWMDHDPRRKLDDVRLDRNPFGADKTRPKPAGEPVKTAKTPLDSPEKLNLKLTGTLLGSQSRLALINGRTYCEGQTVKASSDLAFVVRQIEQKRVTLEREGKPLVLEAVKPRENGPNLISRQGAKN